VRPAPRLPAPQRGVALFTALLIVALATIIAVEMIWSLNLNLRRSEGLLSRDQAIQFALGAEDWARDILAEDARDDGPQGADSLEEAWAQRLPPLLIEGGTLEGFIEDLQGRFNLNNLVNPRSGELDELHYGQFQRLLQVLELDPALADAVVDWIDPDSLAELQGAEDDAYTSRQPPYRAANYPFVSPTELLAVQGFDAEVYAAVAPHVAALPVAAGGDGSEFTRINVNTATEAVLLSLSPQVTITEMESWLEERPFNDLQRFAAFQEQTVPAIDRMPPAGLGSRYFRLYVAVTVGTTRVTMYSLLDRSGAGVVTRLRSFDTD